MGLAEGIIDDTCPVLFILAQNELSSHFLTTWLPFCQGDDRTVGLGCGLEISCLFKSFRFSERKGKCVNAQKNLIPFGVCVYFLEHK